MTAKKAPARKRVKKRTPAKRKPRVVKPDPAAADVLAAEDFLAAEEHPISRIANDGCMHVAAAIAFLTAVLGAVWHFAHS
jgi:hypothetical protein